MVNSLTRKSESTNMTGSLLSHVDDLPTAHETNRDDDYRPLPEIVDSEVPSALETPAMSESPVLRSELERIEAKISEIRKLELETEARIAATIAEDQKRLRELIEDRMALEKLALLAREVLSSPAGAAPTMATQHTTEAPRPTPPDGPIQLKVVPGPRRAMHEGSKRERAFNIIKKMMVDRDGPVHRSEFLDALLEENLLTDTRNPDASLSAMLTHYKNYGLITSDNRGAWSLVSFDQHPVQRINRNTRTVER